MTVYTLFGQAGGTAGVGTGEFTLGVEFHVTANATLTGIWFFSGSGSTALPATIALFAVTGPALVHSESASWSGAAGSGWIKASFSSPPGLTASTNYKAAVYANPGSSTTWYSAAANYWSSGAGGSGITSGILVAPNNAGGDGGQDTFFQTIGAGLTYPNSSFNASNYWVDPEVTSGIIVSPVSLPNAPVNSLYSQTVSASGGTGPYTFSISAGSLPSWLTLGASTGVLSGHVPTTTGSSSFTVRATDSLAATGTQAYTLTITAPQPVGSPTGGPWTLAWNEEFDFPVAGPATQVPDPATWADHLVYGDTWRAQLFSSGDVGWGPHNKKGLSVSGSVLSIITRHEDPRNAGSVGFDPACPATLPNGSAASFTTGFLNSRPGFAYTYGYIEARIAIPLAPDGAYHPAFWLDATNGVWNNGPEVDIQEGEFGGNSITYWGFNNAFYHVPSTPGYDGAYHVYGFRWSPNDATFFCDGAQTGTYTTAANIATWPMFVYLAVQVDNPGATPAGYPGSWLVDYVRAWTVTGVPAQPAVTSITPSSGVAPGNGQLTVSFSTVSGATSYRVTAAPVDVAADGFPQGWGTGGGSGTLYGYGFATGTAGPLTITGLTPGVRYYATVAAVNATGYSIESAPVPSLAPASKGPGGLLLADFP